MLDKSSSKPDLSSHRSDDSLKKDCDSNSSKDGENIPKI